MTNKERDALLARLAELVSDAFWQIQLVNDCEGSPRQEQKDADAIAEAFKKSAEQP